MFNVQVFVYACNAFFDEFKASFGQCAGPGFSEGFPDRVGVRHAFNMFPYFFVYIGGFVYRRPALIAGMPAKFTAKALVCGSPILVFGKFRVQCFIGYVFSPASGAYFSDKSLGDNPD